MDITLIRPPAYSTGFMAAQVVPYLGAAYVAASARKAGHRVDIVDMCGEGIEYNEVLQHRYISYGMPFKRLKERLRYKEVIGFSCSFSQDWPFNRGLIKYVRSFCPDSVLVAGGEHITALPDFSLQDCPELDICVVGEGDSAFVGLLSAIERRSGFSAAGSLVYRDNGIRHTPRLERIKNVDELPYPAWDLMPMESYLSRSMNYHNKRGRTIPMLATRGCPYNCTFCSNSNMWSSPWVSRDPRIIADEMEHNIREYKAENFIFSDLSAVIDRKHITLLCREIIERRLPVTFQLPTLRTEVLDRELLHLMYSAGCRELDFAIESASTVVLNDAEKRNDPQRIAVLTGDALKEGFNLCSNIIIGLPKEGLKEFFKTYLLTLRLALKGMQELNVFPFIPYPGSRLFNDYRKRGEIKLQDRFFLELFSYADLSKALSYSRHFGRRTLHLLRLLMIGSFYSLMFFAHPQRLVRLFSNMLRGETSTKLENVISRTLRSIRVSMNKGAYSREGLCR